MRTFWDRVRHAIMFEIVGLILFIPCSVLVFHQSIEHMGVIGVFSAFAATTWNFFYNIGFDRSMLYFRGSVQKTLLIRVYHSILFEVGLTLITLPAIALYLNIDIVSAFIMDVAIVVFYLVYAFFFNIVYDFIFPIKEQNVSLCSEKTEGV